MRETLFPERQIIFRSRGDVRYVSLGTGTQIVLACTVLFAAGWIGYASVNALYRDRLLEARDLRIAELSAAYDELKRHNSATEQRLLVETRDLELRYEQLLAQNQAALRATEAANTANAKANGKAQAQAQAQAQAAANTAQQLSPQALANTALANAAPPPLPISKPSLDKLIGKSDEGNAPGSIEDLEAMLRASREKPGATGTPKAGEIEARILALRPKPRELADEIQPRGGNGVAALEKALRGIGVDVEMLLNRHADARAEVGVGGPLRSLGEDGSRVAALGNSPALATTTASLATPAGVTPENNARSSRWTDLLSLAHRLPLTLPMQPGDSELSSGFGRRLDPFTKQWAFHAGLDMIGPRQAPIYSSAPGVVVFAGRKGPYGRAVEIDHGLGIKTRYAHLSAINVQLGETVTLNKRIGAMGSTGRSTGQHLHYEILLDDEPVDPAKFIEAGYHVFKQQEDTSAVRQ
ncbi:M23 family metallopeptidase [Ferrovibrio sp.]|uniref:M23 family metallopeptidase n=1 Tax=Ferrovibrio sp. TaxID=1917215 RepID=UPI0025BCC4CD|nr:M23 family metallopeptidase [Ferrovibrio sp.]MBX3456182.1 M23 family metallopeptidase [Ferrovibrio sp.]